MADIERAGLRLRLEGTGGPALLFVHGFGCSLEDWSAQISALSPAFRCVALDLPGHGVSAWPRERTMAALAEAVNLAKQHCGGRDVVLVGHSLGAKVIREAYAQSREAVVGMVCIEGAYYDGDRDTVVRRAQDAIDSDGFSAFAQRHFGAMFVDGSDPALRASVLSRVQALDPEFARTLYLEAVGWDPLHGQDTLRQIKVPLLVLQSTYNDASFLRRTLSPGMRTPFMEQVAVLLPQAEMQVIAGCGHFTPIEAADTVNKALRSFVERVVRVPLPAPP